MMTRPSSNSVGVSKVERAFSRAPLMDWTEQVISAARSMTYVRYRKVVASRPPIFK
jgi:hypothetical protein